MRKVIFISFLFVSNLVLAQNSKSAAISMSADKMEQKVIAWRRDIHEHPELGNRETRTALYDSLSRHFQRHCLDGSHVAFFAKSGGCRKCKTHSS
jgi:metal-dependent amidase/aminoacylase/carboxypeptidase family protein